MPEAGICLAPKSVLEAGFAIARKQTSRELGGKSRLSQKRRSLVQAAESAKDHQNISIPHEFYAVPDSEASYRLRPHRDYFDEVGAWPVLRHGLRAGSPTGWQAAMRPPPRSFDRVGRGWFS
jgi:hypothetical protein